MQEVLRKRLHRLLLQAHLKVMHVLGKVVLALLQVRNTAKKTVLTQVQVLLTQSQGLETLSHQRGDGVE